MPRPTISLPRTILGGAIGSAALLTSNQAAHAAGITELDLGEVLGRSFRWAGSGARQRKAAGFAWYAASGGVLVPLLYWLGFRALGGASVPRGVALGLVHFIASGVLLALTDPRRPRKGQGEGRPMGGFLTRYGGLERVSNGVGHLAYGAIVGAAARRT
jgi:hypothetical protein